MNVSETNIAKPKLGDGVYTKRDVSAILKLPYNKLSRWMDGFWG